MSARRRVPLLFLASALSLLAGLGGAPAFADLADTIERIKPSIVGIGTMQYTRRPPGRFVGTGFAVADGRHVITNAHTLPGRLAVEKKEFLAVLTGTGKGEVRAARIVKRDLEHDLALLSIEGQPLAALRIVDSSRVREGSLYAFTGYPIGMVIGMYPVTHRGIVSAITPVAIPQLSSKSLDAKLIGRLKNPYRVFQLDATAYPGNSGSPVYDIQTGAVIGVINKVFVKESKENILAKPSGITYAIPSSHVRALLEGAGLPAD